MALSGAVTIGEIAEHFRLLDVKCDNCGRHGRYNTAKLVAKYGADSSVQPFQDDLRRDCPERDDPRWPYGKCAPLMPGLLKLPRNQPAKCLAK